MLKKTDAVVVLGELSSGQIDTLVKAFPQITMVISVGSVRSGETPALSGKTHVLGTGSSGYNGHWAMLEFNPARHDSLAFTSYQDPLIDTYDEKGSWADKLAAFTGKSTATPQTPPANSVTPGTGPSTAPPTSAASKG
ncbi:MAG TPA: hypothetical protein VGL38_06335 [bacterium]